MQAILDALHTGMRWTHISLGFAGLAFFWMVIASRKGTALHRRMGMLFAVCAWIVGTTGVFSSLWALLHLRSFSSWLARLEPARQAALIPNFNFLFSILLFLSAATVCGATFGVLVIRHRKDHAALRRSILPFLEAIALAATIWLLGFGIYQYATFLEGGGASGFPRALYFIPIALGTFGLWGFYGELKYIYGPSPGAKEALCKHIEQMGGTGIAFHTAFLVFGANRLFNIELPDAYKILPWILPSIIGGIWIHLYNRSLRQGKRLPSEFVQAKGASPST
jgi:hypothetical protein